MAYTYEGQPCLGGDPASAIREGCELGPRIESEQDWWYNGHPCRNFIAGTHNNGLTCDTAMADGEQCMGDFCGPCRVALTESLKKLEANAFATIREVWEKVEDTEETP